MAFSQYLANKILGWMKNSSFPNALTNVYVSVHTADPGVNGTNNDATSSIKGSGTRTAIASSSFSTISAAGGGGFQITNAIVSQITTSAQNANPTTVTHFGIWDAATGGNFLASGQLTTDVDVQLGDTVQFNQGAMAIKVI
tara:strand:- start:896 stop:1318 length:423 start_codon:yes stop_codon:yes gene_type:complete